MSCVKELVKIINNICNYGSTNTYSNEHLRNIPNDIGLKDAMRCKFSHASNGSTK